MKTIWVLICFGVQIAAAPFEGTLKLSSQPEREYATAVSFFSQQENRRSLSTTLLSSSVIHRTPVSQISQDKQHTIKHHVYCNNLDSSIIEKLRSESFGGNEESWEHIDFKNIDTSSSSFSPGFLGTDSNNEKAVFVKNGELHIIHVPKNHMINLEDLKVHINLLKAHETPHFLKTNLDVNKYFDSFEVSLLEESPQSQTSHHIVKPESQGYVPKGLLNKSNIGPSNPTWRKPVPTRLSPSSVDQHEEKLNVPHFEFHPLEDDDGKSTYDTVGAVDSYGSPINHGEEEYHTRFAHSPSDQDTFSIQDSKKDSIINFSNIRVVRHPNHRYR